MLSAFLNEWVIKQPKVRRFMTRLIEKDRSKFIQVLGTAIFANSIKEHGYLRASRLAQRSSLLRDEVPAMLNVAALVGDADAFVDVGANVGAWCCTIARFGRLHRGLSVWAFEANPDTYGRLLKSAEGLGINAVNIAVSSEAGELQFVQGAVSHVFTTTENASGAILSGQDPIAIAARRLDSFPIKGKTMLIKIDVEGQELEVLRGATAFFDQRRVKAVYVDGFKSPGVLDFLRQYDFRILDGISLEAVERDAYVYNVLALAPDA